MRNSLGYIIGIMTVVCKLCNYHYFVPQQAVLYIETLFCFHRPLSLLFLNQGHCNFHHLIDESVQEVGPLIVPAKIQEGEFRTVDLEFKTL